MGIAMVAIGAYLYVEKEDFLNLMPKLDNINITAVMIAAGIIVFVIAFIGFCGAWMENQCMLIMVSRLIMVRRLGCRFLILVWLSSSDIMIIAVLVYCGSKG
jgi:hypothetical protein